MKKHQIKVKIEKVYTQKEIELIATELQKTKSERDNYLDMAQRQKAELITTESAVNNRG